MSRSFLGSKKLETQVGTSSTKSNAKQKQQKNSDVAPAPIVSTDIPERAWQIAALVILCLATVLRLYDLNLVPLHHDEGVNGNFLLTLVRDGRYSYDPGNYHGPTLYYITAVIPWTIKLFFGADARESYGLTTFVIRLVPVLFGLGTIWLVFLLRRQLGTVAVLTAGLLLAISPGAVYLSRYFIHETLFVFFSLGIVVAGVRFIESRNPIYLLLGSASAAMLFATKETAMITAGVFIIAVFMTVIYRKLFAASTGQREFGKSSIESEGSFMESIGGPGLLAMWIALALVVFLAVNIVFYSSFFTNFPKGVYDSLRTFQIWTKTGTAAHVHPMYTYVEWLIRQESASLLLGVIGAIFVVFRPKNSFALFSALWAFGIIAAYSLVPYKTPWLVLNFVIPLTLIAGFAVQRIFELERGQLRIPVAVLAGAVLIGMFQTIDLNFINYDNDKTYYVYVYAHTKRGTIKLVDEIDKLAAQGNQGGKTGITIVSPDYWPLPWYLRGYSRVGYFGRMSPSSEPIIIASETQQAEIKQIFGDAYQLVPSSEPGGAYSLRPGVNLLLYARRTNLQQ
jgi:uncharacterized protein (TIGR03663 family)